MKKYILNKRNISMKQRDVKYIKKHTKLLLLKKLKFTCLFHNIIANEQNISYIHYLVFNWHLYFICHLLF